MLIEANKSIPDIIRKKTLRWFKKELWMTTDFLVEKMPWDINDSKRTYWSWYLWGSKKFAKYEWYMRMAEVAWISEDNFIHKMEEFIREDVGTTIDPEVAKATLKKAFWLSPDASDELLAMELIRGKYHN